MKKYCIYIIVLVVCTNCKAQHITKANKNMKTFDIKTFEKNKNHLNEYTFVKQDSTIVEQTEYTDEYYETVKPKDSFFKIINRYYKNGQIKLEGQIFPSFFQKGIWKEYDKQGNLLKETDYDKPYKFTWEDVLAFIKKKGFDMSNYYFEIIRGHNKKATTWTITYDKKDEHKLGVVSLDGITGKIIDEHDEEYPGED